MRRPYCKWRRSSHQGCWSSQASTISHYQSLSPQVYPRGFCCSMFFLSVPIPRSYKHFIFTAGQSQHLTVRLLDVPIQFMLFLSNRLSRPSIFIHVLSTSKSFLSKSLFHTYPALQLFLCVFHTLTVLIQHYAVKILARFSKEWCSNVFLILFDIAFSPRAAFASRVFF